MCPILDLVFLRLQQTYCSNKTSYCNLFNMKLSFPQTIRHHLDYIVHLWLPYYKRITYNLYREEWPNDPGSSNVALQRKTKETQLTWGDFIEGFKWVEEFDRRGLDKVLIAKRDVRTPNNGYRLDKFSSGRRQKLLHKLVRQWVEQTDRKRSCGGKDWLL